MGSAAAADAAAVEAARPRVRVSVRARERRVCAGGARALQRQVQLLTKLRTKRTL